MSQTESNPSNSVPSSDNALQREPAVIARSPDGEPVGVAIYVTASDLRALGIIPEGVEAVVPSIANGALLIEPVR